MTIPAHLKIEITTDPKLMVAACTAVRVFAESAGMTERNSQRLELATDEICSNIICHAYRGDRGETFRIEARIVEDLLSVDIYDHGEGFELCGVPEPDIKCALSDRRIGGLGIFLVRKVVDSLNYCKCSTGENCFSFTKRIAELPEAAEA
ncbi:ATP-binding protein [Candidatus Poribacteria bacterium]|nr:ATP-binding protein [Candidatus Poribacteria bacterium]